MAHLRANLVLVGATLLLCSIAYPLTVWIASFAVASKAEGSIVQDKNAKGEPVSIGSRLIAQGFSGNEYFHPRPTATSPSSTLTNPNPYNASASAASNYGANNPNLRDRVARQLGPIVKYRNGNSVGDDVVKWFQEKPDRLAVWAKTYPQLAGVWVNSDPLFIASVNEWWKKANPDVAAEPKPEDVAVEFLTSFAAAHPTTIPSIVEKKVGDKVEKVVEPVGDGDDVQSRFFDMWLQANPEKATEIKPVPADMVTTSGSGLDPHITLRNALYQLPDVAKGWVAKNDKLNESKLRDEIGLILNEKAFTPLLGFGGEPLVNVLEVNLALRERYGSTTK